MMGASIDVASKMAMKSSYDMTVNSPHEPCRLGR